MQKLLIILQLYHHTSDHIQLVEYSHTFRQVTFKFFTTALLLLFVLAHA